MGFFNWAAPLVRRYGDRIAAVSGHAEAMPFPDSSFDGLVVIDAFHHFRDQSAAVEEFARVVRPDGLVLVIEPDPRVLAVRVIALAERIVGEPAAFMAPDELRAFMAQRRILGECETLTRGSYRFLGTVAKSEPGA